MPRGATWAGCFGIPGSQLAIYGTRPRGNLNWIAGLNLFSAFVDCRFDSALANFFLISIAYRI